MFGAEERSRKDFDSRNSSLLKANLAEMYVFAVFRPLIDLLSSVSTGVIIYFGARQFFDFNLTLGILIAFVNLTGQFYRPVMDIAEKFQYSSVGHGRERKGF